MVKRRLVKRQTLLLSANPPLLSHIMQVSSQDLSYSYATKHHDLYCHLAPGVDNHQKIVLDIYDGDILSIGDGYLLEGVEVYVVDLLRPNPQFPIIIENDNWGSMAINTEFSMLDTQEELVCVERVFRCFCLSVFISIKILFMLKLFYRTAHRCRFAICLL